MRLGSGLVLATLLTGCLYPFCGPTEYALSGVSARAAFVDEPWNATAAEGALRALGFQGADATPFQASGTREGASAYVNGGHGGTTTLTISFRAEARGSKSEVDAAADDAVASREDEAAAFFRAFESETGWTLDTAREWDRGTMHGDC